MRNLVYAFALVSFAAWAHGASAAEMSAVNCDALNQVSFVCVRAASGQAITKITCSGFWGTSALSIPEGVIDPGETTVVNFDRSKCKAHIVVFLRDGHQRAFDGFDSPPFLGRPTLTVRWNWRECCCNTQASSAIREGIFARSSYVRTRHPETRER
jgi:hypothetical protein